MSSVEFKYQSPSKTRRKSKAARNPSRRKDETQEAPWNADTVKALRRHLGFSQQEMAQHLGTRQQTISEWERGLYAPRGASKTLLGLVAERSSFRYATGSNAASSGPINSP
jgi:DNA-binding transcriptional regulator YiaG